MIVPPIQDCYGRRGAPEKRTIIRDDLTWDGDGSMEFRLTYEGQLLASNRPDTPRRKGYKHCVRKRFHAQLKRLFEITPFLNTGEASGAQLTGYVQTTLPRYNKDAIAAKHAHYGFNFLPLVTAELKLSCWLDILFLRRQPPGELWQGGDIDNRLKTLFDCLQIPDANQGYESLTPDAGETPFYCLLEDDRLISKITVETDRLLEDLPYASGEGHLARVR